MEECLNEAKMKRESSIGYVLFVAILIITGCNNPFPERTDYNEGSGVFICNEGNMTFGNASLSFYDPSTEEVKNQVFYNTNEFPVGDVLQSMTIIDTLGFLVINNSGKIFVINTSTMRHVATIPGLTSPRFLIRIDPKTVYVSDLYSPEITIIDPTTFEKRGSVFIGNSSEEMVLVEDFAYACSWSYNNMIYKIDALTHTLVDSLRVAIQPNSMVVDKNNDIWVLSDGGYPGMPGGEHAAITCIDPGTFTIKKELVFEDLSSSPSELSINQAKDTLYYINNSITDKINSSGIYSISIASSTLSESPLIGSGNRLFYGLEADPLNGLLYVSDAIDHIQKGWVFRYTPSGTQLDSFKVDIIPGAFSFKVN